MFSITMNIHICYIGLINERREDWLRARNIRARTRRNLSVGLARNVVLIIEQFAVEGFAPDPQGAGGAGFVAAPV